jgi:hypothetical protein
VFTSFDFDPIIVSRHRYHSHRPTPSFVIAIVLVPTHGRRKLVPGFVSRLLLITDPFCAVPLLLFIPEAPILGSVGVGFASRELFAVWAWIRWVAGTAAMASTCGAVVASTTTAATAITTTTPAP